METILGIDLGTTNCSVTAIDENGKTKIIKNKYGEYLTPSAVYFSPEQKKIIVGKEAKEKYNDEPQNVVLFVKREMGKAKEKVRFNNSTMEFAPYYFFGKMFSPEEISAHILKQLKADAESELGIKIKKAVITCPAYFGDAEKNATKLAGEIAGFDVLEIIPEPTAASILYAAHSQKECETVLVFDLGGGTFDVTILKISFGENGRNIEMLATDGNHKLGGKDWDDIIMGYMYDRFEKKYNINIFYESDKNAVSKTDGRLRLEVEKAKVALFKEGVDVVPVSLEYGGKRLTEHITREEFARRTQKKTLQCKTYCDNTLSEANMTWNDIDTVLMIGNMSNCKSIQEALTEWSSKHIDFGIINPKTSVSEGAAIKGFLLEGGSRVSVLKNPELHSADFEQEKDVLANVEKEQNSGERTEQYFNGDIKNVLSASIGIKVLRRDKSETIYTFLKKNTVYPQKKTQSFPLMRDGDSVLTLYVYEGESNVVEECSLLGSVLVHLDGRLTTKDSICVTLSADKNGILQVEAQNKQNNIYIKAEVKRETGLSKEEIEEAVKDAEEFFLG